MASGMSVKFETVVDARAGGSRPARCPADWAGRRGTWPCPMKTAAIDCSIQRLGSRGVGGVSVLADCRMPAAAAPTPTEREGDEPDALDVDAASSARPRHCPDRVHPAAQGRAVEQEPDGTGDEQRDPDLVGEAQGRAAGDLHEALLDEPVDRAALDAEAREVGEDDGHAQGGDEGEDTEIGHEDAVEQPTERPTARPMPMARGTKPGSCASPPRSWSVMSAAVNEVASAASPPTERSKSPTTMTTV